MPSGKVTWFAGPRPSDARRSMRQAGGMPVRTVDLNADLGESYGRWTLGDDEALLGVVT